MKATAKDLRFQSRELLNMELVQGMGVYYMKLHAKNIFLILVILLISETAFAEIRINTNAIKTLQEIGVGIPASLDAPTDIQKQEAFIAAIIYAARNIREKLYEVNIQSITIIKGKKRVKDMILQSSKGTIADFELESQSMVDGIKSDLLEDIINCSFKGQKIVLKNGKLIFPPVDFLKFPIWKNPPETISDITLDKVDWKWNKSKKYWESVVTISYQYDPSKITKINEPKVKAISFEYQMDKSGNYIFESTSVDGSAFGGGDDTPDTIRQKALEQALRNAVEQVNGVYIQALTEVEDAVLTKDNIMSQTLGIAKVIHKKFTPRFTSEGNYEITCAVTAKVPIMLLGTGLRNLH